MDILPFYSDFQNKLQTWKAQTFLKNQIKTRKAMHQKLCSLPSAILCKPHDGSCHRLHGIPIDLAVVESILNGEAGMHSSHQGWAPNFHVSKELSAALWLMMENNQKNLLYTWKWIRATKIFKRWN